jgi:hypothetical protein
MYSTNEISKYLHSNLSTSAAITTGYIFIAIVQVTSQMTAANLVNGVPIATSKLILMILVHMGVCFRQYRGLEAGKRYR